MFWKMYIWVNGSSYYTCRQQVLIQRCSYDFIIIHAYDYNITICLRHVAVENVMMTELLFMFRCGHHIQNGRRTFQIDFLRLSLLLL